MSLEIYFTNYDIHSVTRLGSVIQILIQRISEFTIEHLQYFGWGIAGFTQANILDQRRSDHRHKSTRNTMAGGIGAYNGEFILVDFIKPVKVTTNYIPGTVKYKASRKIMLKSLYRRQHAGLNTLGIIDAVGYIAIFNFNFFFLFYNLFCPGCEFPFKVFLKLFLLAFP